jgi:hypothetical protein
VKRCGGRLDRCSHDVGDLRVGIPLDVGEEHRGAEIVGSSCSRVTWESGMCYAGQFNITVVADRGTCPDAGVFVEGVRTSLDELSQPFSVPS